MKGTRIIELDILRVIACIMVIFMHTPMDNEYAIRFLTNSICYMTSPCIGLFFMVSGALLLSSRMEWDSFLKHRFSKILFPTLFWSLFYIFIQYFLTGNHAPLMKQIFSIPFCAQGAGHLWFMYTLMGLYMLTPILTRWIGAASKKELRFYLFLWAITLCYPLLMIVLKINEENTGILYYFSGYAGYYLLGYYLFHEHHRINWKYLLPLLIISLASPILCRINHVEIDWMKMFWYLSIFVVIMCVCWFKTIFCYGHKIVCFPWLRKFIISFSNLSFGIYLVHFFILRNVLWNADFIKEIPSAPIQITLWATLTITISYLICYFISYLPYSRYVIGYENHGYRKP